MSLNIKLLQTLPEGFKDLIFNEGSVEINDSIARDFDLSGSSLRLILGVLLTIYTGEQKVIDLPAALSKLDLGSVDIRALTLAIATRKLWSMRQYLPGVDTLIQRLGGQLPQGSMSQPVAEAMSDGAIVATAEEFLKQQGDNRGLWLTSKPLDMGQGPVEDPTIDNWLKDFLRAMGPSMRDGLARSQYLIRSVNVKNLPSEEKANVLNFISSYGEGTLARFSIDGRRVTVRSGSVEAVADQPKQPSTSTVDVSRITDQYRAYGQDLMSRISASMSGIEIEIGDQVGRLADIIWEALGVEDKDRVIASLLLAARRKQLGTFISSDLRFIGIIRRFISVRFGEQAKSLWQPDSTLVSAVLFFQLILQDKLRYSPAETAMLADLICSEAGWEQAAYIDMTRAEFRLREVRLVAKRFVIEGMA